MLYPKTILKTHTGETLIRVAKQSFRLLLEVFEAETKNEIYDLIMSRSEQVLDQFPRVIYTITETKGRFYATMVLEADNFRNIPPADFESKIERANEKTLDWYTFWWLNVAVTNDQQPSNTYDDDEDDI